MNATNIGRIRTGLVLTMIIGGIYGFAGLMESLGDFAAGVIVSMAGLIGYGLLDYIEPVERDEEPGR